MRYLKRFTESKSSLTRDQMIEIEGHCRRLGLEEGFYKINDDGRVDVEGHVNLTSFRGSKLPIQFGEVDGDFYCSEMMTTLEGCPHTVKGLFDCDYALIKNLVGGPKKVTKSFVCSENVTSLEGAPDEVGGNFKLRDATIVSLEGGPKIVGDLQLYKVKIKCRDLRGAPEVVKGTLTVERSDISSLEGCPSEVGSFYCGNTLITDLKGGPKKVWGNFECRHNHFLISLKGFPSIISGWTNLFGNKNLKEVNDLKDIKLSDQSAGWFFTCEREMDIRESGFSGLATWFYPPQTFFDSLAWDYFVEVGGEIKISRRKFKEACEDLDIEMPKGISGYTWHSD